MAEFTVTYALISPASGTHVMTGVVDAATQDAANALMTAELDREMRPVSGDPDDATVYNFWVLNEDGSRTWGEEEEG